MRVCTLASGSSGNCTYIEGNGASVLVDAGLSGKAIKQGLETIGVDPLDLDGIMVTHEHLDHIKGAGILSRRYDLKIYATAMTWEQMLPTVGNIEDCNRGVLRREDYLEIEDLKIECFETSHDAAESIGFCFASGRVKVGITTDTGLLTRQARKHVDGSDLLIFEANHDLDMLKSGRYPWSVKQRILSDRGHMSNIAAGHCLASLISGKTNKVILAHLSRDNNTPELAFKTVADVLQESGLTPGQDLVMEVAPRFGPGTIWDMV
ncbi:MBL fold metallo-hydrolase [Phosphitispora fastidiosa]|uniref:MBL fold metallo-hydrolase n=1 Tax=Phosphitispora fastidiosa TaxID=2837202 RepID=UPI001E5772F3|nr:MBL fold metallo-hydrolase [Phosphitispora fastidiosa]MBU7007268.1 phosphoribosyl 1 [Phosphitispora fastidiosa]